MLSRRVVRIAGQRQAWLRAYSSKTETPTSANVTKSEPRSPVSSTNSLATHAGGSRDGVLQELEEVGEQTRVMQAPNRATTWSRSQQPRSQAMVGPRFEQTIMQDQPRPLAAIDLIHKQPVRWTTKKVVSCDGGGGALGHPRIFINTDKPQICWCTYCGLPYANEHHRKHLESLPSTTYPLEPISDPAALPVEHLNSGSTGASTPLQSNTGAPLEQR